ncbi:hypothetical protein DFJ77DRAFT_512305 [Powellomyces hirtus]|nr:hypothetical protein DFJ77DRAFT_512305 [Powellomyces hirtus]
MTVLSRCFVTETVDAVLGTLPCTKLFWKMKRFWSPPSQQPNKKTKCPDSASTTGNNDNVNEDDEDDYMSESLLLGIADKPKEPVTYLEKRQQALRQQAIRGHAKSLKEKEKETREKGLATSIGGDNKGFQMLAKMGYKQGMGIGKPENGDDRRQDPIEIVMREGKKGLGISAPVVKIKPSSAGPDIDEDVDTAISQMDYRALHNQRFRDRRVRSDLKRARKVCEAMDTAKGIERHAFWYPDHRRKKHADDEGDPDEDAGRETMLATLVRVENAKEEALEDVPEEAVDEFGELEPAMQLTAVNIYLRDLHNYCVWCGDAFASAEEMRDLCPGDTAEDHDD